MTDHVRECGPKVKPMSRRTEVESRARKLEVELRDPQTKVKLMNGRPEVHTNTFVGFG